MNIELSEDNLITIRRYDDIVTNGNCDIDKIRDLHMAIANFVTAKVFTEDSSQRARATAESNNAEA